MGDKKAKDLPHEGRSLIGRGGASRTPSDNDRGEGLAARDRDIGQPRTGRNAQGTGR